MASAITQVLDAVELLESILYKLPTRDLLLAQRVSKQWQGTIQGSRKLQRALFFEPVPVGPVTLIGYKDDEGSALEWRQTKEDDQACTVFENAMISKLLDQILVLHENPLFKLPAAWSRPEASWKRMIPTQPLIEVEVIIGTFDPFGTTQNRLGEIVDWARSEWKQMSVPDRGWAQAINASYVARICGREDWLILDNSDEMENAWL